MAKLYEVAQIVTLPGDKDPTAFAYVCAADSALEAVETVRSGEHIDGSTYKVREYEGTYMAKNNYSKHRLKDFLRRFRD